MSTSSKAPEAEASGDQLSSTVLRQAEFPTARRGYSKDEVDALLSSAADALEGVRRERDRLQTQLEAAQTRGSEDAALRDEGVALRGRAAELEARVGELERELGSAQQERDEAASALEASANAPVDPDDLMGMVGDSVAQVLNEAQQTADQLQASTAADAQRTMGDAKMDGERIRREAEQKALTIRRDAQESADFITTEARRDAEAARREAEAAAVLAREEAARDAEAMRVEVEVRSREVTRAAEEAARELQGATERQVRRMRQEAEDTSAARIKGAETLAEEVISDAQVRAREVANQLEQDKEREERIIGQLADAREVLTTHLAATQTGLQRVLTEIADPQVSGMLEVGDASAEEVQAGEDEAPTTSSVAGALRRAPGSAVRVPQTSRSRDECTRRRPRTPSPRHGRAWRS